MEGLVLFIHIFVCLLLVIIVLLQSGKSADLAGAFGGAGSQSTFGPRGTASFLSKMTTTLAILFMITSLTLWIIAANKASSKSVLSDEPVQEQTTDDKGASKTSTNAPKPDTANEPAKTGDQPAATPEKMDGTKDSGKADGKDSGQKADTSKQEEKKPDENK